MKLSILIGARVILVAAAMTLAAVPRAEAQEQGRYGHYEIYEPDNLPRSEYASRRQAVRGKLDSNAAMFVRSAETVTRSNDVTYQYRQRNSLLYLTGVTESGSALIVLPKPIAIDGVPTTEILFVAERNPVMETWTGILMGPEVASQVTGISTVLPYSRLNEIIDIILPTIRTLYYDRWLHGDEREPLTGTSYAWEKEMLSVLRGKNPRIHVKRAGEILNEMRVVKSPAEIALLNRAVEISMEGHRETIRQARPGMHEYELEAIMEYQFQRLGAEAPGYGSIVGSGPNSCILHYETNRRKTEPGDMVVMDCGAEYHGYTADITRTMPISGKFTAEQRAIYDLVLEAQIAGIDACRTGNNFRLPHRKAVDVISAGLIRLGIIKEEQEYQQYFMHGTSHYIGLDVHDVGLMGTLKAGMVLTVEPGIYIAAGSDCDPKWWNIGVRIEDNVIVTNGDPIVMSSALPKRAEEIESLMSEIP